MWSKTSIKSLKHKAKKGVLKKIGKTEEKQEEPIFRAVLFSVTQFKNELKDISFKAHGLANAGTGYNNALEYLCGNGLKGEMLFEKEHKFISCIKEVLCPALSKILETDIPAMDELVVSYQEAKLKYDSIYFQTMKDMTKKGVPGADDLEEVLKNNANLPTLRQTWMESKKAVICHRNVFKGRLDNDVLKALQEVYEVSDAPHHKLYIDYFKERILITSAMCQSGTVSARKSAVPIKYKGMHAALVSEEVEDEKEYQSGPVLVQEQEKKTEQQMRINEAKVVFSPEEEKKEAVVDIRRDEVPALPSRDLGVATADDNAAVFNDEPVASEPPIRAPPPPMNQEASEEGLTSPPARMPPQPPVEVEQVFAPPGAGVPPDAPVEQLVVPPQAQVVPPQPPVQFVVEQEPVEEVVEPQVPAVAPQPPVVPPQVPAMPPQAPVLPPAVPPQPPVVVAQEPEMPPQPPAVPPQPPVGPPQPPAGPPQPPVVPPQPPVN